MHRHTLTKQDLPLGIQSQVRSNCGLRFGKSPPPSPGWLRGSAAPRGAPSGSALRPGRGAALPPSRLPGLQTPYHRALWASACGPSRVPVSPTQTPPNLSSEPYKVAVPPRSLRLPSWVRPASVTSRPRAVSPSLSFHHCVSLLGRGTPGRCRWSLPMSGSPPRSGGHAWP